jgi:hypothetical protein
MIAGSMEGVGTTKAAKKNRRKMMAKRMAIPITFNQKRISL